MIYPKKAMKKRLIKTEEYLEFFDVAHWAEIGQVVYWFFGKKVRHQRTEKVLKKLTDSGRIKSLYNGKRLVYTKRRSPVQFYHGFHTTECLVRLWNANREGIAIPERYFRKLGAVPEFGILYPSGELLLVEFSTKSNFVFTGMMIGKLKAYRKNLKKIEEKFNGKAKVLFILDVPRETVERFVSEKRKVGSVASLPSALSDGDIFPEPFYFTDYETFLKNDPLRTPIYFDLTGGVTCLT